MRHWMFTGLTLCLMAGFTGCRSQTRTVWDNLEQAKKENTELSLKVQSLEQENKQLRQQIETLSGMDQKTRLNELDTLASIQLHKRTGFYDKDNNGTPETLVVYLQTIDAQQDQVKIPGRCTVQLWNLSIDAAQVKLAEWNLEPADLQAAWGGNIFAQYYRIELPIENSPPAGQDLTIRASFTDLLAGKTCTAQTVINRP